MGGADEGIPAIGKALYIDGPSGTMHHQLGILASMLPRVGSVGFFRPFIRTATPEEDHAITLLRTVFHLADPPESMFGTTEAYANRMFAEGRRDELIDEVLSKWEAYKSSKDFVLVSSRHMAHDGDPSWTATIASSLDVPVLYVLHAERLCAANKLVVESDGEPVSANAANVKAALEASGARLAGVVVDRLPADVYDSKELMGQLEEQLKHVGCFPAALLPRDARLEQTSMAEVGISLGAKVLYGKAAMDRTMVAGVTVGTLDVMNLLQVLHSKSERQRLVVAHAGRGDILLSLLLAQQSIDFPLAAGVLLTGAPDAPPLLKAILDGMATPVAMPIICVPCDTFDAINMYNRVPPLTLPSSSAKIEAAMDMFAKHVRPELLDAIGSVPESLTSVSPKLFQHNIFQAAKKDKQHIVLAEGDDPRVLVAASELLERQVCDLTLLGDPAAVHELASKLHVDVSAASVLDPRTQADEQMVNTLFELRKAKGLTLEGARDLVELDPNYFGTMLMHLGKVDGMVSGACHSTASTMRPAMQIIKMAPGFSLVSSIFFMLLQNGVKVFGDCAINVDPNAEQLAEIGLVSSRTARAFGIYPRVAMLSYATGDSNVGPMIDKVRKATAIARESAPDDPIEGPIQFDAAVDPAVAAVKFKGVDNAVAGKATVCIFPDLNSGNNAYKAVQQAAHAIAIGPVMQGLRMPVNDLSRGCTVEDIVNTVVVTCIQSQDAKKLRAAKEG